MKTSQPLETVLTAVIDHRGKTPKKLGADFSTNGVPVASAQLVSDGRLHLDGARTVSREVAARWMPIALRKGDVLLTSEAPLGRVAWVVTDEPLVLGQRLFALRPNSDILDSRYLGYWLMSAHGQAALGSRQTGSTVSGIRQSALRQVEIPTPPLKQQRGIGEVLGALDGKIAANMAAVKQTDRLQATFWRRARTGTTMAQLVDFVIPKLGGTPPRGHVQAWEGPVRWASVKDMTAAPGGVILETMEHISIVASASAPRLNAHPTGSVFISARGTVGHITTNAVPCAINQSAYAFVPDESFKVACRMALQDGVETLQAHAHGSVFSTITMKDLTELAVPDLRSPSIAAVEPQLAQLEELRIALLRENTALARTRDELLPLLMSGRITVKDAERRVEKEV